MGLRETKAERTRTALVRAVLELAERDGYEAVTIEQIAETAEVGISTLYRYFPNKDAILLHPLADGIGALAENLSARPADEPISEALGHALHDLFEKSWDADDLILRLRVQLDSTPGTRARMLDAWGQGGLQLEEAISRRTGLGTDDLKVRLAANVTLSMLVLALDLHRDQPHGSTAEASRRILTLLTSPDAILPTIPRGAPSRPV